MTGRDRQQDGSLLKDMLDRIGIRGLIDGPLERGISVKGILEAALKKPIPHVSWWSCFGGIAFLLFLIQAATGILLMFFYIPAGPEAHRTILYLAGQAPFGWFFRTIHHWAGIGMMFAISVHVLRVFVKGAYQKPRDLNWVIGSILFFLTAGFVLSGDLLPWTRSAYWSTVWWTDLVGDFPVIGHQIMLFLRGGENVTGFTVTRFYVFHVFGLPALTTLFMLIHFAIVRKLGISEPAVTIKSQKPGNKHAGRVEQREYPFYPNHLLRIIMALMATVAVIAAMSALFPLPLEDIADPLAETGPGTRILWILKPAILMGDIVSRPGLVIMLTTILAALFVLLPILDRSGQRSIKRWALVAVPFLLWVLFLAWSLLLSTGVRG